MSTKGMSLKVSRSGVAKSATGIIRSTIPLRLTMGSTNPTLIKMGQRYYLAVTEPAEMLRAVKELILCEESQMSEDQHTRDCKAYLDAAIKSLKERDSGQD